MQSTYTKFTDFLFQYFKIDMRYFITGGFWLFLAQAVVIISGILASTFFAHTLSETEYGTYRYLIGIGVLLSSFSLTGLGQSVLQATAKKYYLFYTESIRVGFVYSLGITAASLIGSLYYFYHTNYVLASGCLLIALLQPVIITYQNIPQFLQGSRRYKDSTILQAVRAILVSFVSICALFVTQNILILLTVYLFTQSFIGVFFYFYYKLSSHLLTPTPQSIKDKYLSYAKHTSIRNLIANIVFRLDTIVIFTQLGAAELAIYTIANLIPDQVKGLFTNLASLLLPKYAQHEDIKSIKKNIPKRSFQLLFILVCITVLYILLSPFIYKLLFPKYESAIFLSQLAALSFPAFILFIPNSALQAQLKERELHLLTIQNAIVSLILLLTLIPFYGLIGAILARTISRYVYLFLNFYHLKDRN